ncbi:peptide-aspartate beta-dioxygenase [Aureococcus anophagefferens]|nr:peptide-aspartate beta-dioxygenase [Aureococcus anophagefferens]
MRTLKARVLALAALAGSSTELCDEAIAVARKLDSKKALAALDGARARRLACVDDVVAPFAMWAARAGDDALAKNDLKASVGLLGVARSLAPTDPTLAAKFVTALQWAGYATTADGVVAAALGAGLWPSKWQRPSEYDAALASAPFPAAPPALRACVDDLEAAYAARGDAMRAEAAALLADAREPREGLQAPGGGSWLYNAGVSSLDPGAHLRPHTGPTNRRWSLHLGLDVAEADEARLELLVGGERRERPWRQGSVVLFDDSFEHEVRHGGAARRVVLDLSVPHPDLGRDASMYRDEF